MHNEDWFIIQATIDDIEEITLLFDLYRQFYEQQSDLDAARKFLSARIERQESVIYLAKSERDTTSIGFVQLYPSFSSISMKPTWILNDLYVHRDHRSRGVATALIEASLELASMTSSKEILLDTAKTNTTAQRLYRKLGFLEEEEFLVFRKVLGQ